MAIVPNFPFNLMFLPEIYGLEFKVRLADVETPTEKNGLLGTRVKLTFRNAAASSVELSVRDTAGFLQALRGPGSAYDRQDAATAVPTRRKVSIRTIFFRLFATVWGVLAIYIGGSGLAEDIRYLRGGLATEGIFDGHTGEVGTRSESGVVSYTVGGKRYHLTSLRGGGIYKLGQTEVIRYFPEEPAIGREQEDLPFDALFVSLGTLMICLAIFSRAIGRKLSGIRGRFISEM